MTPALRSSKISANYVEYGRRSEQLTTGIANLSRASCDPLNALTGFVEVFLGFAA
jgi:hypothetical protein